MTVKNSDFEHILQQKFVFVIKKIYKLPEDVKYRISIQKKASSVYSDVYLCKATVHSRAPILLYAKRGKEKGGLMKEEYNVTLDLWKSHYHNETEHSIPKPVHCFEDLNVLFIERVSGKPLVQMLRYKGSTPLYKFYRHQIEEQIKRAAIWLQTFHTYTRQKEKLSLKLALESDLEYIHKNPISGLSEALIKRC